MRQQFTPNRTPLASREPILAFAIIRALFAGAAVLALAILGFPYEGSATAVVVRRVALVAVRARGHAALDGRRRSTR